jgi:large subunit ribosomal protein L22
MLFALSRGLYKSVHLINVKPIPPPPQFFTPRGLLVKPRAPEIKPPGSIRFDIHPSTSITALTITPNTRFPSTEKVAKEIKTVKATRKYLSTSIKKLYPITRAINRLHVEDAISKLDNLRKKPAVWIKNIIKTGIRSAVNNKGMFEDRLYIKEILLGKNRGISGIRYHGKGKSGKMIRARSQITVIIEEKSVEDFYKLIITGKFSPAIANFLRNILLEKNASYEEVRKVQNLLTAKGRQQQKLMFQRKVDKILTEKKEQGLILDRNYLTNQVLTSDAQKFIQDYWQYKKLEAEKKITDRLEVFNKNQKSR